MPVTKILIANRGEIACVSSAPAARWASPPWRSTPRPTGRPACAHGGRGLSASARRRPGRATWCWRRSWTSASAAAPTRSTRATDSSPRTPRRRRAFAAAGITFIGPPAASPSRAWAPRPPPGRGPSGGLSRGAGHPGDHGRRGAARGLPEDRLPGDAQGRHGRRRQGHAPGAQGRGVRLLPLARARGEALVLLRRRQRLCGEGHRPAAPHRDPDLRRHARQPRLPARAGMLRAAPPPEGDRGGPQPPRDP